ncbi:DUF6232 family protein [Serratia silvae]|uniref:QacE n=1 Tax=Serratia silvae TaxID=2824122 RepID=A0ABT0K981_9GAMM|nr:DUF6232 family protein [Serratia silvae]MCL1028581.1 QacE [Serratia silvae]
MEETEFFKQGHVLITNARFIVGNSTYAMTGVTSVKKHSVTPSRIGAIVLIIVGMVLLINMQGVSKLWGVGVIGLGVLAIKGAKTKHSVYLNSSSGESQALQSEDENYIDTVINALNQAIIHRG